MMQGEAISISALIISAFLLIAIFGRKQRHRTTKTLMLLLADALFAVALLSYRFKEGDTILLIAFYAVLNILAVRKIVIGELPGQAQFNAWHDDRVNWKAGVFYFNPKDKRIFPPKRIESFGWTVNFANPFSVVMMIGIVLFILLIKSFIH